MTADRKYSDLLDYIRNLGSVMVAFSGGVDSTFLLKACKEALGSRVKAVTISAPYSPKWEIGEARALADTIGAEHEVIPVPMLASIRNNPVDRCYLCKKFIFSTILEIAAKQGYAYVIDGSNFDDTKDYRPGLKALKELDVKSPLMAVGLTKDEIRELSKKFGLRTWDKPPYACLFTRIPYGTETFSDDFAQIEAAEKYMMSIGFRAVRVRKHGDLARIEVNRADRKQLLDEDRLDQIAKAFKEIGFRYVTVDAEGYRMGSFNDESARKA